MGGQKSSGNRSDFQFPVASTLRFQWETGREHQKFFFPSFLPSLSFCCYLPPFLHRIPIGFLFSLFMESLQGESQWGSQQASKWLLLGVGREQGGACRCKLGRIHGNVWEVPCGLGRIGGCASEMLWGLGRLCKWWCRLERLSKVPEVQVGCMGGGIVWMKKRCGDHRGVRGTMRVN